MSDTSIRSNQDTLSINTVEEHVTTTESQEKNPIIEILNSNIGDHREFAFGPLHADILPSIIYDNGLDFYPNTSSMIASGKYKIDHHKVVKTSDGKAPKLDLSITNMVAYEFIGLILLFSLFFVVKSKYSKNKGNAPKGMQNLLEVFIIFIRDEVVKPNVPEKPAARLLPYFISLFFMILILNMIGMIPGAHAATSVLGVTAALAITSFFAIQITAIKESGWGAWFHHLLGGAPLWLAPLMIPIEILSMFIKPLALTMRLFANMTAGHMVIFSFIGLIFLFQSVMVAPVSIAFALFIYLIETLVIFLQAYIFTLLTAIFVGLAIGDHSHEEHGHEVAHGSH